MATPAAPLLDASGKKVKEVKLVNEIFAAEARPHLVHETVRAEAAAARSGTHAAKSRGQVAGGRAKPWRQKGTGRARAGSIRAPQWTGGAVAFPPRPRRHDQKVNRKARKAAVRSSLSQHARRGTLGIVDGQSFTEPSTKAAAAFLDVWGAEFPVLVVADADEHALTRSFRNLERTVVVSPSSLEVRAVLWARSLLVSQAALARVQGAAS